MHLWLDNTSAVAAICRGKTRSYVINSELRQLCTSHPYHIEPHDVYPKENPVGTDITRDTGNRRHGTGDPGPVNEDVWCSASGIMREAYRQEERGALATQWSRRQMDKSCVLMMTSKPSNSAQLFPHRLGTKGQVKCDRKARG